MFTLKYFYMSIKTLFYDSFKGLSYPSLSSAGRSIKFTEQGNKTFIKAKAELATQNKVRVAKGLL